jgi:hypothetical protein
VHSGIWFHIDETNFNIFYKCDLCIYFIFIDHYKLDGEYWFDEWVMEKDKTIVILWMEYVLLGETTTD